MTAPAPLKAPAPTALPDASPPDRKPPDAARPILANSWWASGLNLRERLPGAPAPADLDRDARAARRLGRWRDEHQLEQTGLFQRRLDAIGVTPLGLAALLVEAPAALAGRTLKPAWAATAEQILADLPAEPDLGGWSAGRLWGAGFLTILAPFWRYATQGLAARIGGASSDVDVPAVLEGFAATLARSLISVGARTLVLELNVWRVSGRLTGSDGAERFDSFVRRMSRPEQLTALCAEYPVLTRLLVQLATLAADAQAELLLRLAADRAVVVQRLLAGADPGPLVEVQTGGDTHHGGRAVAILRFANGARVVYKPRPLSVHGHFNDVMGWLNRQVPELELRRLALVERAGYGWLEYAEHGPCADLAGVRRYYRRQGALLALLYALDGADFHYENLIACGDQPVLIDLEALLHPSVPGAGPAWALDDPARRAVESSVARSALLPLLLIGENGAVDMSGLGADKNVPMPIASVAWSDPGTDEMRLTREYEVFTGAQNRPRLGATDADPTAHLDDLVSGFRDGYQAIARRRDELATLLSRFAADEVRAVVRPTRTYAKLLDESTHPDFLRDALDRDRILDHLWAASVEDPTRQRLTEGEIAELWAGDVPLFTARPDRRDLCNGNGVVFPAVLPESSIAAVLGKLAGMGPADLSRQERIIRSTIASRRTADAAADPAEPVDPQRLAAAAYKIGDRLAELAYPGTDRVNWLGLSLVDDRHWMLQPLGFGLLNGSAGIALFLAQLAALTGEERYAVLCRHAVACAPSVAESLTRYPQTAGAVGGLDGPAGLAFALTAVARLLGDPELAAPADTLLDLAAQGLDTADSGAGTGFAAGVGMTGGLGVAAGAAGCLAASTAIVEATGSPAAARAASAAVRRLLADPLTQRQPSDPAGPADPSWGGLGNGPAGVGWALLRSYAVTGAAECRIAGLAAFAAERASGPSPRSAAGAGWYAGPAGSALARLDTLRHVDDPVLAAETAAATRAAIAAGPALDHSLCHGETGDLDLLSMAAGGGRPAIRHTRTRALLAQLEGHDPRCATPGPATPALATGLAGIGYGLLRLAYPDRAPSLLLLRLPADGAPGTGSRP